MLYACAEEKLEGWQDGLNWRSLLAKPGLRPATRSDSAGLGTRLN